MDEFEKREKRDLQLYKLFCESLGIVINDGDIKVPTDKFSHYDATHRKYFLEYKCRHDYAYDSFNDFALQSDKVEWLKELYENYKEKGCKGSKVIVFYPKSDKVVVIDIHRIIWKNVLEDVYDCNRVYVWKHKGTYNKYTTLSKQDKIEKEVYSFPLPHHEKINCVNVFDFPGLGNEFKRLNDELGIII